MTNKTIPAQTPYKVTTPAGCARVEDIHPHNEIITWQWDLYPEVGHGRNCRHPGIVFFLPPPR